MKLAYRLLICLAAGGAIETYAGDQSIQLQYTNPPAAYLESPPGEAFWERFQVSFDHRLNEMMEDRFNPYATMIWNVELGQSKYDDFNERLAKSARNAVSKSAVYGLREAAVDLPIMLWLKERQGILADFFRNSLGSVAEEEIAPLDVTYRAADRSWWKRMTESGDVRYGIRPFRTSPYAFLSMAIKDGDDFVLLSNVRYYYNQLAEHRFEIALSLPLPHGLAIDVGASYLFGRDGDEKRLVVNFLKQFKSGGTMHIGFEAREHPTVFAGLSLPW